MTTPTVVEFFRTMTPSTRAEVCDASTALVSVARKKVSRLPMSLLLVFATATVALARIAGVPFGDLVDLLTALDDTGTRQRN
jgi:hypothetical protein